MKYLYAWIAFSALCYIVCQIERDNKAEPLWMKAGQLILVLLFAPFVMVIEFLWHRWYGDVDS